MIDMFCPDLSHYLNLKGEIEPNIYAVGWLDERHPFQKGTVEDSTLERILALCFCLVNQTRGFHQSPFVHPSPIGYPVEFKDRQTRLGSAEIRVGGKNGISYAAPNLIYHYIKDCGYLPPQEFLDAVDSMAIPSLK